MKRALLALILALPLALSAQFRIVGTGLFTTLNDSTYRAKIDFRPDLTGNSYNATQLNDSMLVLSQKGQLYRLDSFYNASFSSAFIVVVEKNGNWGSPVGQVMVFQNNSSLAAPQAVYGANGATAGMQAGVDTWNALLLKVVSDSAVYWNQAYSNSIDSLNVSGDSLKTITLYRANGDSISATFVDGGGGGGGLTMPFDSVTFNVNETDASLRELKYSEEKGYLQYGGQDSVQIPLLPGIWYVRNDTSVTIPKGTVLRATGTLGASGRIKVKHMIANGSIDAMYILGIAMHDIAVGADGYAMSQGKIRQVNTQAYSEGAVLYADVDTLGGLTQTEPGNGFLKLPIAFVVHSASNGTIAVRITSGAYMRDLHDTEITSPVSNASLYYNSSEGIWRDTTGAVLTSDTSVFARDFQISGTANRLAMFTGSNTVGNSIITQNGRSMYINSTQDNSGYSFSNAFQFNGFGSGGFDQPVLGIIGNVGTTANHRPYLSMYRSAGSTVDDKTLVPYNYHLGSITWQGADGIDFQPRGAEITAITDSITGVNDMPTALFFGTTANGQEQPTERMRITSSGNVGIGTASPSYRLDVNGDVNTTGMYKKSGTDIISGTTNRLAMFTGSNTVGNSVVDVTSDTVSIRDYSNSYNTWRFHSNINKRGFIGYPSGTRFYSLVNPSSYAGFMYGDRSAGAQDQQAFTQLTAWNGSGAASGFFSAATTLNGADSTLYFNISGLSADANPTFPAAQMVIQKGGNVGIGTSDPASFGSSQLAVVKAASRSVYNTWLYSNSASNVNASILRVGGSGQWVDGKEESIDLGFSRISSYYKQGAGGGWGLKFKTYTASDFATNESTVTIDPIGNVGIGATPSGTAQILDLYRASASLYPLLRGNSTAQDYAWTFSDGTNTAYAGMMGGTVTGSIGTGGYSIYLPSGSGSPITFSTNATERMRITSAGNIAMLNSNVGLNTTTPTAKLHINNPSSTTPALNIVSNSNVIGSTNDAVRIDMTAGQVNQTNYGIRIFNGGFPSNEGDAVGIQSIVNARNTSYGLSGSASKNWGGASLFGSAIGVYGSGTTDSPAGFSYGGYFKNDTTQGTGFGVFVQTTTPKGSGTVTPLAIQHNSTELMRVQSSGNVGIATSSPSRPLHVNANSSMIIPSGATGTRPALGADGDIRYNTTNANFEWYSGATWREPVNAARSPNTVGLANRFSKFDANGLLDTSAVLIQNGSNIGIGTSSATNLLTIKSQSTSDIPVSVRSSAASNINIVALSESNGAGAMSLKDKNGNTDIVLNTDITAFNISNDTTPPYIIATSYSPTAGNGPELNLSRARGTEASPSAVSNGDELGEINFSGRSTSGGQTTAAIRALADSVVTSRLNTGLAFYTGATTATLTERMRINSKGNVGIGNSPAITDSALTVTGGIRATTGVRATRFNVNTFSTQVVSINNFAPTGANGGNLFIGNGGASLTLGGGASSNASSNLGIGFGALQSNTTASLNLAVGGDALVYTTTGSENIAIGQAAGAFLTTGTGNTYIGRSAGLRDSTSSYNIGIGAYALQLIGTGGAANENIAIGNSAGENLRAGSYNNVMIGASAAKTTAASAVVTSLNSSVYIGNYTTPSATTGVSNEIAIGYQTAGNGSNTTTIGNSSTTNTVIPAGSLTVDVMRRKAPVTVTGNHTVAASTSWLICDGTGTILLTLPTASSWTGREIMVKTIQPQAVNSAANNVVPIDGVAAGAGILPATDGAWCTLVSDGTNWIIMQRGN